MGLILFQLYTLYDKKKIQEMPKNYIFRLIQLSHILNRFLISVEHEEAQISFHFE